MSAGTMELAMVKGRKNSPVRIDEEALKLARIAASYKQLGLAEYISQAVEEMAKRDIEKGHAELSSSKPKAKKGQEGPSQ